MRVIRWCVEEIGLQGTLLIGGGAITVDGVYVLWGDGVALLVAGIALATAGLVGGIMERVH